MEKTHDPKSNSWMTITASIVSKYEVIASVPTGKMAYIQIHENRLYRTLGKDPCPTTNKDGITTLVGLEGRVSALEDLLEL